MSILSLLLTNRITCWGQGAGDTGPGPTARCQDGNSHGRTRKATGNPGKDGHPSQAGTTPPASHPSSDIFPTSTASMSEDSLPGSVSELCSLPCGVSQPAQHTSCLLPHPLPTLSTLAATQAFFFQPSCPGSPGFPGGTSGKEPTPM